jgi:hypothetical protein
LRLGSTSTKDGRHYLATAFFDPSPSPFSVLYPNLSREPEPVSAKILKFGRSRIHFRALTHLQSPLFKNRAIGHSIRATWLDQDIQFGLRLWPICMLGFSCFPCSHVLITQLNKSSSVLLALSHLFVFFSLCLFWTESKYVSGPHFETNENLYLVHTPQDEARGNLYKWSDTCVLLEHIGWFWIHEEITLLSSLLSHR